MRALSKEDRILITGGTGLIGRNLSIYLESQGYETIAVGSEDYDLRGVEAVRSMFSRFKPTVVFHLAAKVGGIYANSNYKSDFYIENVLINTHVIDEAAKSGVDYIFAMGTGCAYPKRLEGETLHEEEFLDGVPEITNDAYAYAKRGLLVHLNALRENELMNFTYCLPANIFGPYDNFHPTHSHVVPGLVRRFVEAKESGIASVAVWGSGSAKRDFLYIDDCVEAIVHLARNGVSGPVNVGTGVLTSISQLSKEIASISGFEGAIEQDKSLPDGQKERIFDLSKIRSSGWSAKRSLSDGLLETISWFESNRSSIRER